MSPTNKRDTGLQQTLMSKAYRTIRDRIFRGVYPIGAEISRRKLAAELGMSIVPINDALVLLGSEYLVENIPRVGTRVRIPTPLEIRGFWAVREGLETQAARLFARNATGAERQELRAQGTSLDQLHEATTSVSQPEPEALYRWRTAHMDFHLRIAAGTHIPFLYQAVEKNQILVFNWFYEHSISAAPVLPALWHEKLAAALCQRSENVADEAMRDHLRNRVEDLLQRLEEHLTLDRGRVTTLIEKHS